MDNSIINVGLLKQIHSFLKDCDSLRYLDPNIVVGIENLEYIVQYCDNVYSHFKTLLDEDEKKNERLKYEFKNFDYKKILWGWFRY